MKKEDRLCMYIEKLINHIYCGRATPILEDAKPYNNLIDGLKKIGFKFDFSCPVKFKELKC